ncbi:GTP cyclohydrolase FolE2 [Cobetia amphilecti]|uniref:GTP cyclohydrolase FolE2 n=1 Tax=Cobetia amphilecti TaxID=1055104 RepID=UPI001C09F31C|nr:GTP cyclohydrolase FolE2 [Cobetia amphilecti]MBU3007693.1 GTP cyclohydrolase I FolE2 [Cobetia amphilecti]
MTAILPDVSLTERSRSLSPLEWVGMQGIDLPVLIEEGDYRRELHAHVDAQVDLPMPHTKGIHMSRLYRLLDGLAEGEPLTPGNLQDVLAAMVASHHDCASRNARVRLEFALLVKRPALVTPQLSGWKSYPVTLEASLHEGRFTLQASVTVGYSSTCPCSAALSRQLIEQAFLAAHRNDSTLTPAQVAEWLTHNATLATPHSQRSEAQVQIELKPTAQDLGLIALIDAIEQAVATPVQTAVKRADEQAFAALNGQNLMFVEDAARRLINGLAITDGEAHVHVRHIESLHPHDAVAWGRRD